MMSETSIEAYRSMNGLTLQIRARILAAIAANGDRGATCDEMEIALGLSHQSCSPRIYELRRLNSLIDSGLRRKTRSGRSATVWRVLLVTP